MQAKVLPPEGRVKVGAAELSKQGYLGTSRRCGVSGESKRGKRRESETYFNRDRMSSAGRGHKRFGFLSRFQTGRTNHRSQRVIRMHR